MNPNRTTGHYVTVNTVGETVKAFVPAPLPPVPPLEISPELQSLLDKAMFSLGGLKSVSEFLPNSDLFNYIYLRKEAVYSSQIEGTQSTLDDLLKFENNIVQSAPLEDVEEVLSYVQAMNHGLERLKSGFPLSLRLVREMHGVLMSTGRGSNKMPGEFRRSQNWIGGTRPGNAHFVPPPVYEMEQCLSDWEKFMYSDYQPILKAGLLHVQFETIHPFLDGNSRMGRLLITFMLCVDGLLNEPMLYASLFFRQNRQEYYERLDAVRTKGDWEGWMRFFVHGISETAENTLLATRKLMQLCKDDEERINQSLRRGSPSLMLVHREFCRNPIQSRKSLSIKTKLTAPTVNSAIQALEKTGIVREVSGRKRDSVYLYEKYIDVLRESVDRL